MNCQNNPGKCVLIVDDDLGIRSVLGEILELEGYKVVCATDGANALQYLRDGLRPSLILLDLMMPGMNGWEFREMQRRDPALSSIPIVVLSGADKLLKIAAQLDARDILRKPVELDALLDVVRRHCKCTCL